MENYDLFSNYTPGSTVYVIDPRKKLVVELLVSKLSTLSMVRITTKSLTKLTNRTVSFITKDGIIVTDDKYIVSNDPGSLSKYLLADPHKYASNDFNKIIAYLSGSNQLCDQPVGETIYRVDKESLVIEAGKVINTGNMLTLKVLTDTVTVKAVKDSVLDTGEVIYNSSKSDAASSLVAYCKEQSSKYQSAINTYKSWIT